MQPTTAAKKMTAPEKRLRALSEQVKQHLVSLGCTLLSEAEKCRFYDWEVTLPTDAGKLSLSVHISSFDLYKTDTFMVHGRFEKPELFPAEFCQYNHINPYSGKWNSYVEDGKPETLTEALRYFSRMIPILDATPELTPAPASESEAQEPEAPASFHEVVLAVQTESAARTAALPVLKRGQRVEDFLYGPCTVTRRVGNDYYVKFDDGTKARIGRGDLSIIEHTSPAPVEPCVEIAEHRALARVTFADDTPPTPELAAALAELIECATEMVSPTSPAVKNKTFPFLRLHREGRHVKLLHQTPRCAIAQVWDEVGATPYYLIRYLSHYQRAFDLDGLPAAFAELRARVTHQGQHEEALLSPDELSAGLQLTPAQWDALCSDIHLEPCAAHTRQAVRKALTAKRGPLTGHYLSLLNKIPTTN